MQKKKEAKSKKKKKEKDFAAVCMWRDAAINTINITP